MPKRVATGACATVAVALAACGAVSVDPEPSPAHDAGAGPGSSAPVVPSADAARGRRETCNGLDDDLDDKIDEGCPIRLTRDPGDDISPSIDGRRVAWQRSSRDGDGAVRSRILLRELTPSVAEVVITEDGRAPSLFGDRMAFIRGHTIILRDLRTGVETEVWTHDGTLYAPLLTSELVVWYQIEKDSEEDYEVYAWNIRTQTVRRVGGDPTIQADPRAHGSRVAWIDDRRGHHTIHLLHLFDVFMDDGAGGVRAVTNRAGDLQISSVAGVDDRYVLINELHGPVIPPTALRCAPVLVDVASGARRELSPPSFDCIRAAVLAGERVVLEQEPEGVSDLLLLDIPSGQTRRVTDNPRRSTRPALGGTALAWQDDRNDNWDIYLMDLSDVAAGDFSPEGLSP